MNTNAFRVGPLTREAAERILSHAWGYVPRVFELRGRYYVVMRGHKDGERANQIAHSFARAA